MRSQLRSHTLFTRLSLARGSTSVPKREECTAFLRTETQVGLTFTTGSHYSLVWERAPLRGVGPFFDPLACQNFLL